MSRFAVVLTGLEGFDLSELDAQKIKQAAQRAINTTARDGRALAARKIRQQVAFPGSYVAPGQGRLSVTGKATRSNLQAEITARARTTSLARFVVGNKTPGRRGGVYVAVKPGKTRFMKRAFLFKLRSGGTLTDTVNNLGLAMRLKPGEVLRNKNSVRQLSGNLYLLYGPSVDQVFRATDGEGVATDIIPDLERDLTSEFLRQLRL